MQAQLVFSFPVDVSAADAIHAVANHFAVGVSIMGHAANVPVHIKAAVESVGKGGVGFDPSAGVETTAAMAFAGLVNGGNVNAASGAGAATLPTAHAANPATSQTTPPAASVPAPPTGNAAGAPVASAATTNPASNVSFDSSGLVWDERIHSGNKTLTPGGEWRTKKGVDKSLVKTVELELRAKFPNAAAATNGQAANAPAGAATSAEPVTVDPAQAAAHAHAEAVRVAGPQQIDDACCAQLIAGVQFTLSPEQAEWYSVYQAKYHAAHAAFLANPVASAPPAATASPQTTGNEAASPLTPAASLTVAAGTAAPATVAPQGELDATGLPHDKRIHIGAPLKDAAGVWIQRHDVAPDQKLLIMAELRAALDAGNAAAQASNTPDGSASIPVAPTPPAVPVVTAEVAGTEFAKMMQWIVLNVNAKRIPMTAGPDAAKMLGFVDANGNGQLALMTQQKDYWPHVIMLLQGQGAV